MTRTDYTRISQGLSIYKQARSPHWFAQIYIGDRKYKSISTKEKSKIIARKVAEELFLEMKGNKEINVSPDRKFKYFANELVKQEKQLSKGETRSKRFSKYTQQVIHRDEKGLIAFFGHRDISKITTNHILIVCNEKVSSLNHLVNSRNMSNKSNYFFNAKNKNNGCDSFSKSIYESEPRNHLANRYLKDK